MLPAYWTTSAALSSGTPSRSHAAWMMRMFAWCGTTIESWSAVIPAAAIDFWAESTMMRTARRNTSLPSIWMVPPSSA